ncbi:MAG: hypothetical protein AAFX06_23020 [Planctomycetota bacterium]
MLRPVGIATVFAKVVGGEFAAGQFTAASLVDHSSKLSWKSGRKRRPELNTSVEGSV